MIKATIALPATKLPTSAGTRSPRLSRSKRTAPEALPRVEPENSYQSTSRMFEQLSALVLARRSSRRQNRAALSEQTGVAMIQSLRAAAAELLDIEYIARTETERSKLVSSVLTRLCAVADSVARTHDGEDVQPAALVTPNESRQVLADCRVVCGSNAA